jgi:hypothetical protein
MLYSTFKCDDLPAEVVTLYGYEYSSLCKLTVDVPPNSVYSTSMYASIIELLAIPTIYGP